MPIGILLFNVASLSTSLGALAALAALAVHLRSRGLFLLLGAVLLLAADYVLGIAFFARPDSPLWLGLPGIQGSARWVLVAFGLKGACHVGLLLLAPAAVLALFGRRPPRAASAAAVAASAALVAAMGLVVGGILPAPPVLVYALTALPAYAAYVIVLAVILRLRRTIEGPGPLRTIATAAAVLLSVTVPALLVADVLGLSGVAPRPLPVDPVAFLALTVGILVCSLLVLLGSRSRAPAGDVDAFCARHGLSVRERDVLLLLGRGLQYKQVAAELGISLDTVKTHVSRIYSKTGSTGKTDLFYRIRLGSS